MALAPAGKFHEWKGRKQAETTGYPAGNGPPFLDPKTGAPIFPAGFVSPVTLVAGTPALLAVTFTAANGQAPYTFDFGDGSPPEVDPDGVVPHTFAQAGTFAVKVRDALGRGASASVTVAAT